MFSTHKIWHTFLPVSSFQKIMCRRSSYSMHIFTCVLYRTHISLLKQYKWLWALIFQGMIYPALFVFIYLSVSRVFLSPFLLLSQFTFLADSILFRSPRKKTFFPGMSGKKQNSTRNKIESNIVLGSSHMKMNDFACSLSLY